MRVLDASVTGATAHPVATEYTYSTLNGILTCCSNMGTALYKPHVAGQEESGCVSADGICTSSLLHNILVEVKWWYFTIAI